MENYPWSLFFIVLAAGLFGSVAVLPYGFDINPNLEKMKEQMASQGKKMPSRAVMMIAALVQSAILVVVATFLGLLATRAVGLDLPVLRALLAGEPALPLLLKMLPVSLVTSITISILLVVLERYFFQPRLPESFHQVSKKLAFWKRALVCFYGGIVEEILLRLFVMGGVAWLLSLVWKAPSGAPAMGALVAANLVAALLFGIGHLPATKQIMPLTPLVVTRALLLNGMMGIAVGFLFIFYGFEAAVLAHFTGDIMIHLVFQGVQRSNNQPQVEAAS